MCQLCVLHIIFSDKRTTCVGWTHAMVHQPTQGANARVQGVVCFSLSIRIRQGRRKVELACCLHFLLRQWIGAGLFSAFVSFAFSPTAVGMSPLLFLTSIQLLNSLLFFYNFFYSKTVMFSSTSLSIIAVFCLLPTIISCRHLSHHTLSVCFFTLPSSSVSPIFLSQAPSSPLWPGVLWSLVLSLLISPLFHPSIHAFFPTVPSSIS